VHIPTQTVLCSILFIVFFACISLSYAYFISYTQYADSACMTIQGSFSTSVTNGSCVSSFGTYAQSVCNASGAFANVYNDSACTVLILSAQLGNTTCAPNVGSTGSSKVTCGNPIPIAGGITLSATCPSSSQLAYASTACFATSSGNYVQVTCGSSTTYSDSACTKLVSSKPIGSFPCPYDALNVTFSCSGAGTITTLFVVTLLMAVLIIVL